MVRFLLFFILMRVDLMVWNCQGAGNVNFHKVLKEYIREFEPAVVVLVETRVSGVTAECVIKKVGMPFSHRVEACGFSGGIWVLWKSGVDLRVEANNFQFVHMKLKLSDLDDWMFFTGVYGSPRWGERRELWLALGRIATSVRGPWLLAGDFNALLSDDEKKGGVCRGRSSCPLFQQFCFDNSLKDMGFVGPKFTWNRGQCLKGWIGCFVTINGIRLCLI